jgi:hypothetical protein
MESGDSEILPSAHCLAHRGEAGWFPVLRRKLRPGKDRLRSRGDGIFFLRSLRSLRRGRVFTDGGGREWRKPFGIPTERPGLQLGESYGSERQVRGGLPQAAWRESRSEIHWEGANPMDSDGEGCCRGDFVAGLGTRFVGGLRGSVAAPIGKPAGGMARSPSRPTFAAWPLL